jgi:hypothetical protein
MHLVIATLPETAAFYWAGIAYAILLPQEAIAWADELIGSGADVPTGVYDLSLSPAHQPKRVVSALRSLHAEEDVSEATVRSLLDILGRQLGKHALSPATAIQRAYEVTRRLHVDSSLWIEAMMLEENYSLAVDRIVGEVPKMDRQVESWLAQFEGEATRFDRRAG